VALLVVTNGRTRPVYIGARLFFPYYVCPLHLALPWDICGRAPQQVFSVFVAVASRLGFLLDLLFLKFEVVFRANFPESCLETVRIVDIA